MASAGQRIFCPHCQQESALQAVKRYDGFTLVGQTLSCGFCGHEFVDEEPPPIAAEVPDWADDRDVRRVCHRCRHYVKNPFAQKCGRSGREVEALDTCSNFSARPPPPPPPPDPNRGKPPAIF